MLIMRKNLIATTLAIALCSSIAAPSFAANDDAQDVKNATTMMIENEKDKVVEFTLEDEEKAREIARQYFQTVLSSYSDKRMAKYWQIKHKTIQEKVQSLKLQVEEYERQADKAMQAYEESRNMLASFARETSRDGAKGINDSMRGLLRGTDTIEKDQLERYAQDKASDVLSMVNLQMQVNKEAAENFLAESKIKQEETTVLLKEAEQALEEVSKSREKSVKAEQESMTIWSELWKTIPDNSDDNVATGNKILNEVIVDEWEVYLDEIDKMGIEYPSEKELLNVNKLPDGLEIFPAVSIDNSTGVAFKDGILIPSKEAVERVTKALSLLNSPYAPVTQKEKDKASESDSTGWSCQAFTSYVVTGEKDQSLNSLYENAGRQNSTIEDTVAGDIVFFADPASGIHHAGIYLFGGMVITASASNNAVSIEQISADALASVRPGLSPLFNENAPEKMPDSLPWECGGLAYDSGSKNTASAWVTPFDGDYKIGTKFGDPLTQGVKVTGSGKTDGVISDTLTADYMEFLTPDKNTPVRVPFDGTVKSVKKVKGKGNEVIIKHSATFSTRIDGIAKPAVAEGAKVKAGTVLGVASEKYSSQKDQYSVRISLLTNGEPSDPNYLFFPQKEGKFSNGQIPESELCPISSGGLLRCDAARTFEIMNAAYKDHFGTPISVTDTYRSLAGQYDCRARKGNLCATPGTSNHGWGLAIDLGGGINRFGTEEHLWMVENASRFGWVHPEWAQATGSKPEAWHWEFHTVR